VDEAEQPIPARLAGGIGLFDVVVVGLALAGLLPVAANLAAAWGATDYMSYGGVVAPVSLWIAWTRRRALRRLPAERQLLAAPLLLVALGLGRVPVLFLQGVGLVLAVWACVWLLRGSAWVKKLLFPLSYLAFVIPPPDTLIASLTFNLRLLVTELGLAILHVFELPVAREGSVIILPTETLFVAEACSGISSVFSMLPASVLLGYFTQHGWRGRLALVASVVPIAMFWNLVRVLVTVVGSLWYGSENVAGPLHEPTGLLTFSLGCATLIGFDVLLARRGGPRQFAGVGAQARGT